MSTEYPSPNPKPLNKKEESYKDLTWGDSSNPNRYAVPERIVPDDNTDTLLREKARSMILAGYRVRAEFLEQLVGNLEWLRDEFGRHVDDLCDALNKCHEHISILKSGVLIPTYRCQKRYLCPTCLERSYRSKAKDRREAFGKLYSDSEFEFSYVTLTKPNVEDLVGEIEGKSGSFKHFLGHLHERKKTLRAKNNRSSDDEALIAWRSILWKIETTLGEPKARTRFHPHLHLIVVSSRSGELAKGATARALIAEYHRYNRMHLGAVPEYECALSLVKRDAINFEYHFDVDKDQASYRNRLDAIRLQLWHAKYGKRWRSFGTLGANLGLGAAKDKESEEPKDLTPRSATRFMSRSEILR